MYVNPNVKREELTRALARAPEHCRPILRAVRDHGCAYAMVLQDAGQFDIPVGKPAIVLLGDDLLDSKGPVAFDADSTSRLARRCGAAFVIASAAEAETYGKAVTWPILFRQSVLIVETLPKHEEAWVEFLLAAAPGIQITVSKVDPLARPEPQTWGRA